MTYSETELTVSEIDRQALETLVVDNADLERLETLLDRFNIFEAVGAVRQELRHSDFLAFLLNPQQNHGLGDTFVKRLLQKALVSSRGTLMSVTPIDLDVWSLDETTVLREWQNIDVLLLNEPHRLAVIIENKIGSSEHSDQLIRYRRSVSQHYPSWNIIGLYLTLDGETPSDESYLPIDYGLICEVIEGLCVSRATTLGLDTRTLMIHYAQMLRRHIVSESEIAELCLRIYHKHTRALDLIFEYRPDQQAAIREVLERLIRQTPGLVLDHCSKGNIKFCPTVWDVPVLLQGKGWTRSGRILLFEFINATESLKLKLIIGPGPDGTRRKLFDMARDRSPTFRTPSRSLNIKWNEIFARSFLTEKSYEEASNDKLEEEIGKHWVNFAQNDFPAISAALNAEKWIWPGELAIT